MRGLFAVGPDMAELLAVVSLRKTWAVSVCLILDNDMAEASKF